MATTVTTRNSLDVTLIDSSTAEVVLRLNNPSNSVTRKKVEDVFSTLLGGIYSQSGKPIIYSKYEVPFTAIGAVQTTQVVTTKKDVT